MHAAAVPLANMLPGELALYVTYRRTAPTVRFSDAWPSLAEEATVHIGLTACVEQQLARMRCFAQEEPTNPQTTLSWKVPVKHVFAHTEPASRSSL